MRFVRLVLVNLLVLLVLLGGIEAAVRVAVPEAQPMGTDGALIASDVYGDVPGLAPGAVGQTNGVTVRVTEDGVWQYTDNAEGKAAWLLLGDSVTMGLGVEADSTVGGRLAARQDTARVVNPSLVGYGAGDYEAVGRAWLARAPTERVTVLWCLNDAYRHTPTAPPPGLRVPNAADAVLNFLRRHVRTYAVLKATLTDRPAAYLAYDRRFYDGTLPDTTAALARAADHLAGLAAAAEEAGAAFEVVAIPYAAQLRAEAPADALLPQRRLERALARRGLALTDAAPAFQAYLQQHDLPAAALYLYGDGIHLNALGHAVLADAVARTAS